MKKKKCTKCKKLRLLIKFSNYKRNKDGKNSWCKKCAFEYKKENLEKTNEYEKRFRIKIKNQVFDYYGNACNCCYENYFKYLVIDHINGGGCKHRNELNLKANKFYKWLLKLIQQKTLDGYKIKDFQILCRNCNWAKGSKIGKYCPNSKHKKLRRV